MNECCDTYVINWLKTKCCNIGDLRLLFVSVSDDYTDDIGPFDTIRSECRPKSDPCDTFGTPWVEMPSKYAWNTPIIRENLESSMKKTTVNNNNKAIDHKLVLLT